MNYFIVFFPTLIIYIFSRYKKSYFGLKIAFIFLFVIGALRFDYGNDYIGYYKKFILIAEKGINQSEFKDLEIGYLLLNKMFSNFKFNGMLTFLSGISCYVYYDTIKRYLKRRYFWMAVFFYLINTGIYFIELSAIRQAIAINLFILSISYFNKNFFNYFCIIVFASLFHKSVLMLIPFYLFFNNRIISVKFLEIINVMSLVLVFYPEFILKIIKFFVEKTAPKYIYYFNNIVGAKLNTGFGLIINLIVLFMLPFLINIANKKIRVFIKVLYLQYLIAILSVTFMMISRIGMYTNIGTVIGVPYLISRIKDRKIRVIVFLFITLFFLYNFDLFFRNPIWIKKFGEYKTIIFNEY